MKTNDKDIGDPGDDATDESPKQHDSTRPVQEKTGDEGTLERTPHYDVDQLQSLLRCDPAHDKKYDQIQPDS